MPFTARFFIWRMGTFPFALPVHRLRETSTLLAFYHPAPSSPVHILLVPRKPIQELNLPAYRLIINGGAYQEFPYLHFHLISG